MMDKLKSTKADYVLSSVIYIVLGILFIIYQNMADIIGISVAIILILLGVIAIASYCFKLQTNILSLIVSIVIILFGAVILIRPEVIQILVPIILGALTMVFGIRGMKVSRDAYKLRMNAESNVWAIGFVTSVISFVVGVFFVLFGAQVISFAFKIVSVLIGVGLIFNGVSNIWVAGHFAFTEKDYNKEHPIDTEFIEEKHK